MRRESEPATFESIGYPLQILTTFNVSCFGKQSTSTARADSNENLLLVIRHRSGSVGTNVHLYKRLTRT